MNYDEIQIEDEVNKVVTAMERGELRPATKKESMSVRLAALSAIVHELQMVVKEEESTLFPKHAKSAMESVTAS
jgi:hypothetical protein